MSEQLEGDVLERTRCPDCNAELEVPQGVTLGEILSCPGCGLELEVRDVHGSSVDLEEIAIEGEDWGE
jgi:alpha-aminoadipate carrier protein LysW